MSLAVIRTLIGLGGIGGVIFVVYLETLLVFPETLRFICVPVATLGGLIGFGVSFLLTPKKRLQIGVPLFAVCVVVLLALLMDISSDYTWEFWIIYGAVFLGNGALFLLAGEGILRLTGQAKDLDSSEGS